MILYDGLLELAAPDISGISQEREPISIVVTLNF